MSINHARYLEIDDDRLTIRLARLGPLGACQGLRSWQTIAVIFAEFVYPTVSSNMACWKMHY